MQASESIARASFDAAPQDLDAAIANYQGALEALAEPAEETPPRVLGVLVSRDVLARLLANRSDLTSESLKRIAELDGRLEAKAPDLATRVGPATLASWRAVIQPRTDAWWWSLDETAAAAGSNPLWAVLAGAFLALSLSLATEISLRFLSGGADFLGVLSSISQALLALLAGSVFTRAGGKWAERLLGRLGIAWKAWGAWKAALALAVLLAIIGLRLLLPGVARLYNDRGVLLQREGRVASARQSFERAIRLHPDYAEARYNLAGALEETLDYGDALGEYQQVIKSKGSQRLFPAYNNLARLYILRSGDPASALKLLDAALALEPKERDVRYSLLKNRGWAGLDLGYLRQAEADLRQAIELREDGAAAHCLLAQVLEAKKDAAALEAWEMCVAYAPGREHEVEASWVGLARERLWQGGQP